jgi:dTDP-4-dehydrorhamnose 3,5-epimerase
MSAIDGLQVIPLQRIPDERGEIYFSSVYRDVIKGWHRHRDMTLNYACVFGRVKVVVYDDRTDSATHGELVEVVLGPDNHSLVVIPPGVWNGFKGLSDPFAIVANCCTHPHDPSRSERLDPVDNDIPYDWAVVNH